MNTSRQLTDLIKNKARSLGIDAQLLLKRYFMEQMLARIAVLQYKTNFLKLFKFVHNKFYRLFFFRHVFKQNTKLKKTENLNIKIYFI